MKSMKLGSTCARTLTFQNYANDQQLGLAEQGKSSMPQQDRHISSHTKKVLNVALQNRATAACHSRAGTHTPKKKFCSIVNVLGQQQQAHVLEKKSPSRIVNVLGH
jgi:hypothetical protein